jgi:hypothetical protein
VTGTVNRRRSAPDAVTPVSRPPTRPALRARPPPRRRRPGGVVEGRLVVALGLESGVDLIGHVTDEIADLPRRPELRRLRVQVEVQQVRDREALLDVVRL